MPACAIPKLFDTSTRERSPDSIAARIGSRLLAGLQRERVFDAAAVVVDEVRIYEPEARFDSDECETSRGPKEL